jgi:hypothetical protein
LPEERVPDDRSATIVLAGNFNPSILQPWWFAHAGLVSVAEAERASAIVLETFTQVSFSTFAVEALRERVVFTSLSDTPTWRVIRDIAVQVFRVLEHTPISAVGMNHLGHIWLRDGGWQRLEDQIAPRAALFDEQQFRRFEVRAPRLDKHEGYRQLTIEPSAQIDGGAWMAFNSHVQVASEPTPEGARAAADVVEEEWEASLADAERVIRSIREFAS